MALERFIIKCSSKDYLLLVLIKLQGVCNVHVCITNICIIVVLQVLSCIYNISTQLREYDFSRTHIPIHVSP